MKKISKIILTLILIITLVGCTTNTKTEKDFSTFVKELPEQIVSDDGFNLNYLFYNASEYGFEKESNGIEVSTNKEYDDNYKDVESLLDTLQAYDYDTLTKDQQKEYDILKDYLERSLLLKDYTSFENSYLGSFIGFQAQLPLLLMEFSFNDKKDIEIYLDCLKKSPDSFQEMVDVEQTRQKQGTGMSQKLIDGVKEQAKNFASGDTAFLITSFNEKIDQVTFLTNEEKQLAKVDNEKYTKENLVSAYTLLAEELTKIDAKQEDGGIYGQEGADDYYVALFQNKVGLSFDIKELEEYINDKEKEYQKKISKIILNNPNLQDFSYEDIKYDEFKTVEENTDYLSAVYSKYYPQVEKVDYVAKVVPDSMKDNFSPAAYLTSRIDRTKEPLMIIVNGEYEPSLYDTIAHEGYPGHMYQDCYFKSQNFSTFRYLTDCSGYAEGWATYVEDNSYRFIKSTDQEVLQLKTYLSALTKLMYCKWDIAINYDGMTRAELAKDIEDNFGKDAISAEDIEETYNNIMETPTNYLQYYISGFYFQDLYDKAKKELGNKFDEVAFHKVILDMGPVGMELVEKYVDQYIEDTK